MPSAPSPLSSALADRYLIERELGHGGMATVYLAEDLKHRRKVAIKVLRAELAAVIGADRFLAEITTTANLQHPNILPLHDSGEAGSFLFYVMPYVEGESLRDRLSREKQLPITDAVRIATEVAGALDYAHRRGVIHRDIKPENILLHDGRALVADFGIALAAKSAGGRMTETGMSLGTPHYMSPEQAMGEREIGPESDVYALGAVTYEMLVGEPPFTGPTAQSIVAKMVTDAPRRLIPQRHTIPPHVEAAVLTALEKLPADRFVTAKEFADALGSERYTRPMAAAAVAAGRRAGWWKPAAIGATTVALLAIAFAITRGMRAPPPVPVSRFIVAFPDSLAPLGFMLLSRDGSRLVYPAGNGNGGTRLMLKDRDRAVPVPIPGTDNSQGYTISPDGQSLVVVLGTKLMRMPVTGGTPTEIADSVTFGGVGWSDDGWIYYTTANLSLARVPATGGAPTDLWRTGATLAGTPALANPLPGGRSLLFTLCGSNTCANPNLYAFDVPSRKARLLVPGAVTGWYLPTGQLAYAKRDGVISVVGFDLAKLELRGTPQPVLRDVSLASGILPTMTISATGTLLMETGKLAGEPGAMDLVWVDRAGVRAPVDSALTLHLSESGNNVGWSISPDGKQLAIGLHTRSGDDIWVKDLPAGRLSRLTFDTTWEVRPRWSPDGRSVMFVTSAGLGERRADGTGESRLLVGDRRTLEGSWSNDGKWIIARIGGFVGTSDGGRNIVGFRPGQDTAYQPLVASSTHDEEAPALSPDGKWLAYQSDETGAIEIFIRPFPSTDGGRWQVSLNGGQAPLWAHSGRELFYVDAERNLMAVPVAGGVSPGLGEPRKLFSMADDLYLGTSEHYTPFDISPDDKRFIMVRTRRPAVRGRSTFVLVENWFEELRGAGEAGKRH